MFPDIKFPGRIHSWRYGFGMLSLPWIRCVIWYCDASRTYSILMPCDGLGYEILALPGYIQPWCLGLVCYPRVFHFLIIFTRAMGWLVNWDCGMSWSYSLLVPWVDTLFKTVTLPGHIHYWFLASTCYWRRWHYLVIFIIGSLRRHVIQDCDITGHIHYWWFELIRYPRLWYNLVIFILGALSWYVIQDCDITWSYSFFVPCSWYVIQDCGITWPHSFLVPWVNILSTTVTTIYSWCLELICYPILWHNLVIFTLDVSISYPRPWHYLVIFILDTLSWYVIQDSHIIWSYSLLQFPRLWHNLVIFIIDALNWYVVKDCDITWSYSLLMSPVATLLKTVTIPGHIHSLCLKLISYPRLWHYLVQNLIITLDVVLVCDMRVWHFFVIITLDGMLSYSYVLLVQRFDLLTESSISWSYSLLIPCVGILI